MSDFSFFVNATNNNPFFDALGSGPLTSVTRWSYTARLDRAGTVEFDYSANDPQAEYVTNRRAVYARALLDGVWTEVGIGIVDKIDTIPNSDGHVTMRASGLDIIGELGYRNVRSLEIGEATGATLEEALTDLNALAPLAWIFEYIDVSIPENDYFYAKFDGESLLGALIYLADKTYVHFRRDVLRGLIFSAEFVDSGVRAIQAQGSLSPHTCAITGLTRTVDTHGLLTRIYPYGSGEDRESSLTLAATGRSAPAGYTLDTVDNYIENDAATTLYGLIDFPEISFKEITPITNTNADYQAASDMLFDSALAELQRRSSLAAQYTYDLSVAGCSALLRPLQTIRLVYRDPEQGIDIDEDLYILEATWEMDTSGIRTSRLTVSTHDVWPKSSGDNATERAVGQRIFQAHPQISLNEYWVYSTLFVGPNTTDHIAKFPFVLGPAVVMVKQVLFRFKVESVLSAAYTYALAAGQTDLNAAAVTGNTNTTDTAVSNISVTGGTNTANSGASSAAATAGTNTANSTGPSTANTGAPEAPNTDTGAASITFSGIPSVANTANSATGIPITIDVNPQDDTTNLIVSAPDHIHTLSHGHPADLPQHQHTLNDHTHNVAHTHSLNSHLHSMSSHTHPITHTHNMPHDHTITHNHNVSHVHAMPHDHASPQHVHILPDLLASFGLTRALASRTYAMADMEFAINGGSWVSLDTATGAGDGYFQLDITNDVTHPTIPFRPAQASGNNLVEIRRKSTAANFTISNIVGDGTTVTVTTSAAHGLGQNDTVIITGTTSYNGTWVVDFTTSTTFTYFDDATGSESAGTVNVSKTAMILAQLGIRTTIQAVAT